MRKLLIFLVAVDVLLVLLSCLLKNYTEPVAVVVPHHNIVQEKRSEFFQKIAEKRPKTRSIIILSPDHFSSNQFKISYADREWQLSNGDLEYDVNLGSKLVEGLAKENGLVVLDHGIYNLLPDIKKVWPQAKIVPILIGQRLPLSTLNNLEERIGKYCLNDCLLVASVDFSHYLPRALADVHDVKSLAALEKMAVDPNESLEVDSQQSLYILTNFARLRKAKNWHLFYHSNSGEIDNLRDTESTSHFFGWYQTGFIKHDRKMVPTFMVATNLNKEKDIVVLGERFFYGVDYFDGQLKKNYLPSSKVIIEPVNNLSGINISADQIKISLGNDLVLAGYTFSGKTTLLFLPLGHKDQSNFLLRGEDKTEFFKKLFQNVIYNNNVQIDSFEGIVVI